ncbi:sigma-B regulation protein RsbU (phosphoserine phosphatase) [Roseinatronobacter thiooxidans]|uniref:Sigma-B regulation protein RsbU (Phosphoserine phosphatase) n=1 Tax=Roseinatronobacter thiooxidans TaxID=121821 RepID=A0A2W7Q2P3_9RHOB|nr:sigma-B regulation protein RsbU (phosphoserine phosphatase) [Roseinatronobacter thiooxidans]
MPHKVTKPTIRPDAQKVALIVDDSRAQRLIFAKHLQGWGYRTHEAGSGLHALEACSTQHFDLILSDWMMPEMDGLEFCRAFRAMQGDRYSYFILLTSKNDKTAVAEGLDVGADDFLPKPVSPVELRARITAGERLLAMEREVRAALEELQNLYDALDRDLMEARRLQQSLIRKRQHNFEGNTLSLLLQSSGHVGGDMVGTFIISTARIGVYAIDVSGHGVAAAMLGARVAGLFSGGEHHQNIVLIRDPGTGKPRAGAPHEVAARINDLMLEEFDTETYLTVVYADIDLRTGRLRLVQAGHPHPVIQRADGRIEYIGEGGLPIGLIPNASFATIEAQLMPGDRLLLYSDGITECTNQHAEEFGEEGLKTALAKLAHLKGVEFVDALKWELLHWSGKDEFEDDVSGALFEFNHAMQAPNAPPRYYRGVPVET